MKDKIKETEYICNITINNTEIKDVKFKEILNQLKDWHYIGFMLKSVIINYKTLELYFEKGQTQQYLDFLKVIYSSNEYLVDYGADKGTYYLNAKYFDKVFKHNIEKSAIMVELISTNPLEVEDEECDN